MGNIRLGRSGSLKESLLERIAGQSFQPIEGARIISVLSAVADPVLAERVFSRLCEVKQAISTSTAIGEKNETNWAISRQLEDLLRAIPPNVVALGLLNRLAGEFNATEFNALIDTFGRIGPEGSYLRSELQEDLRQNLRRYLTDAIPFALSQDDSSGRVKIQLALALARVGDPEDMVYLSQLIEADIQRIRMGRT